MIELYDFILHDFFAIFIIIGISAFLGDLAGRRGVSLPNLLPPMGCIIGAITISLSFFPIIYHFQTSQETFDVRVKIFSLIVGAIAWFLMGTNIGEKRKLRK